MQLFRPASEVPELQQGQLLQLVERWDNACHSSKAAASWLHSLAVPLVQGCPRQPWPMEQQMKKIIIVLSAHRAIPIYIVAMLSTEMPMCRWLREEKRQRKQLSVGAKGKDASNKIDLAQWSNGWAPGRMTASIRDSSNTVMRM